MNDTSSDFLWTWHYQEDDYHIIQDERHTSAILLEEIARTWYDDGARNWIEYDGTRVATIHSATSIQIGG